MATAKQKQQPGTRRHVRAVQTGSRGSGIQLAPVQAEIARQIDPVFDLQRNGAYLETETVTQFGTFGPSRAAHGSTNVSVTLVASTSVSRAAAREAEFGSTYLVITIGRMRSDGEKWVPLEDAVFGLQNLHASDIPVLARAFAELHAQMVEDGTLALVGAPTGGTE